MDFTLGGRRIPERLTVSDSGNRAGGRAYATFVNTSCNMYSYMVCSVNYAANY